MRNIFLSLLFGIVCNLFVIEAKNNSKENLYVKEFKLNGETLSVPSVKFQDVVKGGKLEVEMSASPSEM